MAATWLEKPIKGVLLDISGVLRDGDIPIPGSVEAFHRLKNSGIPVQLVTNESQVTREGSQTKLTGMGYKGIEVEGISAPAPILVQLLKDQGYRPHLLVHHNLRSEFNDLVPEGKNSVESPNCVVIGDAAEGFTYENMNNAFRKLIAMRESGAEPQLFTLGKGRYYKEDGDLQLDVGPFAAGLEYALDIKAQLVGKPSESFFHGALKKLGISPEEAVMIGDDILGDVKGSQNAGLRGVLVRTGKFRPSDENHCTVTPDAIVDNLAQAVDLILKKYSKS